MVILLLLLLPVSDLQIYYMKKKVRTFDTLYIERRGTVIEIDVWQ